MKKYWKFPILMLRHSTEVSIIDSSLPVLSGTYFASYCSICTSHWSTSSNMV